MYNYGVRTTIELRAEHRAKLLELAARRGEKGFSSVIAEAIEDFLKDRAAKDHLRSRAIKLRGSMTASQAEGLRRNAAAMRKLWR